MPTQGLLNSRLVGRGVLDQEIQNMSWNQRDLVSGQKTEQLLFFTILFNLRVKHFEMG